MMERNHHRRSGRSPLQPVAMQPLFVLVTAWLAADSLWSSGSGHSIATYHEAPSISPERWLVGNAVPTRGLLTQRAWGAERPPSPSNSCPLPVEFTIDLLGVTYPRLALG
jgi:hypothetical protein